MSSAEIKPFANCVRGKPRAELAKFPDNREIIILIAVVALGVLVSLLGFMNSPRIYEAHMAFQLPSQSQDSSHVFDGMMPSAEELETALLVKFDLAKRSSSQVVYPRISGIRRIKDALFLSAEGYNTSDVVEFLEKTSQEVLTQVRQGFSEAVSAQEQRIAQLSQDDRRVEGDLELLNKQATDPRVVAQNPALLIVAGAERAKLLERLLDLRQDLAKEKATLIKMRSRSVLILKKVEATRGGAAVKPRLLVFLAIGAVLSFILGMIVIAAKRFRTRLTAC